MMTCIRCQHGTASRFGTYGKSKIQRYRCKECRATFTEPRPKPLGSHYTDIETACKVIAMITEGMSVRAVSRLTGLHKGTILALLKTAGEAARRVFDAKVRDIRPRQVELDELWGVVHTKQGHLRDTDPPEWGDAYTWLALDRETKAVLAYHVGKRDGQNAFRFVGELRQRTEGIYQITSDGLDAYIGAIEDHFGIDVNFAQLVKVYSKPKPNTPEWYRPAQVVGTFRRAITGTPDMSEVSTSRIERLNLSFRMHLRRLTRLTNGFSKRLSGLKSAVDLFVAWYNFCRVHQTVRVTPMMEAGVTDHIWTIRELLEASTGF